MGNNPTTLRNINFEDLQFAMGQQNNEYQKTLLINTLDPYMQACLIGGTLNIDSEVDTLNMHLKNNKEVRVIVYGMNATDITCMKKYEQLMKLGFYNVFIYAGGMFEWLLLQDVYGPELFPTTTAKVDLLKYKGRRHLNLKMLEN
jgi:hypothetical protein